MKRKKSTPVSIGPVWIRRNISVVTCKAVKNVAAFVLSKESLQLKRNKAL
jgi:hypothetical protein